MNAEDRARYRKLARDVAEGSIVTGALARLIEQIIAEVHESKVAPLRARIAELDAEVARLRNVLADLMSWFPAKPGKPEWRIEAGEHGADDAIEAARRALTTGDETDGA